MPSIESDRWFHIEQDRKRERTTRKRRSEKRHQQRKPRAWPAMNPNIEMTVSEWTYDEHGNLTRTIYGN